jgi:hypothetical protein
MTAKFTLRKISCLGKSFCSLHQISHISISNISNRLYLISDPMETHQNATPAGINKRRK